MKDPLAQKNSIQHVTYASMRQGNNQRRGRGRSGRRSNVPLRAQTFESAGPEGRVRGNPTQVYEKYIQLARDTQAAGDRVLAESFQQHAEHYYRILNESMDPGQQRTQPRQNAGDDADDGEDDSEQDERNDNRESSGRSNNRRNNGRSRSERAAAKANNDEDTQDASPGSASDENGGEENPAPSPKRKPAARSQNTTDTQDEGSDKAAASSRGNGARRGRPRKKPETSEASQAKTEESGNEEEAGLLKILGESPKGESGGSDEGSGTDSEAPQQEEAPKRRRRRTTVSSDETSGDSGLVTS